MPKKPYKLKETGMPLKLKEEMTKTPSLMKLLLSSTTKLTEYLVISEKELKITEVIKNSMKLTYNQEESITKLKKIPKKYMKIPTMKPQLHD